LNGSKEYEEGGGGTVDMVGYVIDRAVTPGGVEVGTDYDQELVFVCVLLVDRRAVVSSLRVTGAEAAEK
jgi:hypothetical protein